MNAAPDVRIRGLFIYLHGWIADIEGCHMNPLIDELKKMKFRRKNHEREQVINNKKCGTDGNVWRIGGSADDF